MPDPLRCQWQVQEQQKHERQTHHASVTTPFVKLINWKTHQQQHRRGSSDLSAEKFGANQINREKQKPDTHNRHHLLQDYHLSKTTRTCKRDEKRKQNLEKRRSPTDISQGNPASLQKSLCLLQMHRRIIA